MRRLLASLLAMSCALSACERGIPDMVDQKRYKPLARSSLFADGQAAREAPGDTVPAAVGMLAATSSGRMGAALPMVEPPRPMPLDATGRPLVPADAIASVVERPPVDAALVARGRERYDIACAPCHSVVGDGDGMIVRRGFPRPPSFHVERLRRAPDPYVFGVITHGYGVMAPFGARLSAKDRWAIVAYVRALQRSQHASLGDATPAERVELGQATAARAAPEQRGTP